MFSDERVVEVAKRDGQTATFVVQPGDVLEVDDRGNGKLRVVIMRHGASSLAMVPTTRREAVQYMEADLIPA